MVKLRWRCNGLLVGLVIAGTTSAGEPLSLADALRRAIQTHPDLQAFASERAVVQSQRSVADRPPAGEVAFLIEDAFGTGDKSALDEAQWTLGFSQALELAGQRGARVAVVDAQSTALAASQEQRRRDALAEVARRYIEAVADAERLVLAERQLALAATVVQEAARRVAAARAPAAERFRAQAALAQARLEREHAAHTAQSARVSLAVALGQREPDFGTLQADLFDLPPLRPLAELQASLAHSPAAITRLAAIAVRNAERHAALADGALRPTVTAGVRRYEQGDDFGFMFGVSVPLGTAARARHEADRAAAGAAQAETEHQVALLRAHDLLFAHYQELGHAKEALALLEADVLPALAEAREHTQEAYARGRYGYQEFAQAIQDLSKAEREHVDTAALYHARLTEVERLTGLPLIERRTP